MITAIITLRNDTYNAYLALKCLSMQTQDLCIIGLIASEHISIDELRKRLSFESSKNYSSLELYDIGENPRAILEISLYKTNTPYIFTLNSDVLLYPNCLERCLRILENDSKAILASTLIQLKSGQLIQMDDEKWGQKSTYNSQIIPTLSLIKKSKIINLINQNNELYENKRNIDFSSIWIQLLNEGNYSISIPEILIKTDQNTKLLTSFLHTNKCLKTQSTNSDDNINHCKDMDIENKNKLNIAVVSWDLAHNPVGRAYLLADLVKQIGNVDLVGAIHPEYGSTIWPPLKNIDISVHEFKVENIKYFIEQVHEFAINSNYQYVYVCKPRFPSILIGYLLKYYNNCPLILDIDDHELSFFKTRSSASYQELEHYIKQEGLGNLYDEIWTRFSESIISSSDAVTVSNISLKDRYGGIMVRHARNEMHFNPDKVNRSNIRREFNYNSEDKVILFIGTPRPHKGIYRIASALEKIDNSTLVLCIIGTIRDKRTLNEFHKYKNVRIHFHEDQPWDRLPELVSMADLICILQDQESPISEYQIPAKLTDALSMGIPIIASNVKPLHDLIASNYITAVNNDSELKEKIQDILLVNPNITNRKYSNERLAYLCEFSYAVNVERIKHVLQLSESKQQTSFANINKSLKLLSEYTNTALPSYIEPSINNNISEYLTSTSSTDHPINIIFFWKQNDSDIYGRRQDMMIKYLSKDKRIGKILHFDSPISVQDLRAKAQKGPYSCFSQDNLVFTNTIQRFLEMKDSTKIYKRTFIYSDDPNDDQFLGFKLHQKKYYVKFIKEILLSLGLDSNLIAWVCPVVFDFPGIQHELKFKYVVTDIIDDQRKWNINPKYRTKLQDSYNSTLSCCNIAFTNCQSTKNSFLEYVQDITIIPNGSEIYSNDFNFNVPEEIHLLSGPIIGYVGNLSDRIDIELLKYIAVTRNDWNLVIIGSTHGNSEIYELTRYSNVHLLGVKIYSEVVHYIKSFDVAIIPHLDNELTRSMNPLKLYVYYSLNIPIVSTAINNIDELSNKISIAHNYEEFIEYIQKALNNTVNDNYLIDRENILSKLDWQPKIDQIIQQINADLVQTQISIKNPYSSVVDTKNIYNPVSKSKVSYSKTNVISVPSHVPKNNIETNNSLHYEGRCSVCSNRQIFYKNHKSLREGYQCNNCKSTLRYRGQVDAILSVYSKNSDNLEALLHEQHFVNLSIYEPGAIGPFRKYFSQLKNYSKSFYWEDVNPGAFKDGIQCQDLENLTYPDNTFDLVITSDILEHVRHPWEAIREIYRVLKPGGYHIFSIPITIPIPKKTIFRVDTSNNNDIFLLDKIYHSAPALNNQKPSKSLVYTDFGNDINEYISDLGIHIQFYKTTYGNTDSNRLITCICHKE